MIFLLTLGAYRNHQNLKKYTMLSLAIIAGFFVALFWDDLLALISLIRDREQIVAHANALGYWGPFFMGSSIILQILVAVIPGHPLLIASGYLYGFAKGFILSWIFIVIATQITFQVARKGGRPIVSKLVGRKETSKWERFAKFNNIGFYLLTFNLPMFPSDIMGYVAGLSNISTRKFFIANSVGRVPVPLLLAYLGAYGVDLSEPSLPFIFGILAIVVVGWLLLKRALKDSQFEINGDIDVEK